MQFDGQMKAQLEALRKTRQIAGSYPVETWIALFEQLIAAQRRPMLAQHRIITALNWLFWAALAITLLLLLLGEYQWLILAAVVAGALFGLLQFTRRKRTVYPPIRLAYVKDTLLPMLRVLQADVLPGKPVRLEVDLRGWNMSDKRADRVEQRGNRQITSSNYTDPWLNGAARLADGAQLRWQYTIRVRERKQSWRNRRGKYKTKSKGTRYRLVCKVRLSLPARAYSAATVNLAQPDDKSVSRNIVSEHLLIEVRQQHQPRVTTDELGIEPWLQAVSTAYRALER